MAQSYEEEIVELRARLEDSSVEIARLHREFERRHKVWTNRDRAAVAVMGGLVSSGIPVLEGEGVWSDYAEIAYSAADAMLAERAKGGGA